MAVRALFGAEGEDAVVCVVTASLWQLSQTRLVRVEQCEVGGGAYQLDRLRLWQKRGGLVLAMLPSCQMRRLCADLRGWQREWRARRPLLRGKVLAQVAAGS